MWIVGILSSYTFGNCTFKILFCSFSFVQIKYMTISIQVLRLFNNVFISNNNFMKKLLISYMKYYLLVVYKSNSLYIDFISLNTTPIKQLYLRPKLSLLWVIPPYIFPKPAVLDMPNRKLQQPLTWQSMRYVLCSVFHQ